MVNEYLPFASTILNVKKHTDIEYTFRMPYDGTVKPGQFFEVSIPKFGEAPISVSGIGDGYVELAIRRVGKVTNEIFERYEGDTLFMRGPYGSGFDLELYKGRELIIIAGGTGVSPVRGVIDYFSRHRDEVSDMTLIAGFKSPDDLLFREDFDRWAGVMNLILTVDSAPEDYCGHTGLVTNYIPQLAIRDMDNAAAIVVGPPAMMRFSVNGLKGRGLRDDQIWVSYERKMCCGIGKCGHCKMDDTYICLDGPVFLLHQRPPADGLGGSHHGYQYQETEKERVPCHKKAGHHRLAYPRPRGTFRCPISVRHSEHCRDLRRRYGPHHGPPGLRDSRYRL